MIAWIKQKRTWVLLAVILIALDIYHKEVFFSVLLAYGLTIKFFLSDYLSPKLRKIFAVAIWTTLMVLVGVTVYVNYYLPHGPSYPLPS